MNISDLQPHPKNPRKINDLQLEQLKKSMAEFGDLSGIVFNKVTGRVVGGHQRLKLIPSDAEIKGDFIYFGDQRFSYREVQWDEDKEKAANIAANKHGGEWDNSLLADFLIELDSKNYDMDLVGFTQAEMEDVCAPFHTMPDDDKEDVVSEPPKVAKTKLGELWLLGEHRLLVDDSCVPENVKKIMGDRRAVLMNTDPPYGVSYTKTALSQEEGKWEEIENDNLRDQALQDFLTKAFKNAADFALIDNAAWYLWHAHLTQGFFAAAAAAAAKVILHRQIIWVKQQLILGRGMFHWKHEPCFMGWREGHRPEWYSDRTQTTVWDLGPRELNRIHPTQKPVMLFELPIGYHTKKGDWIYDPFAGSGSQIIAAEKMGRRCAAIELSPNYADAILTRFQTFCNTEPMRQNEDGSITPWSEL